MTDEKLIDALQEIATEISNLRPGGFAVLGSKDARDRDGTLWEAQSIVERKINSIAVLEKAYTPTDDDRKAMLESIQAGMDYYMREDIPEDGLSEAEQIADFLSDAGFRRVRERS